MALNKARVSRRAALLAALLAGGLAGHALADTHYVDPAGSNTPPFTSPATAALTIGAALAVAQDGDTVSVAAATYAETVSLVGGTGAGFHNGLTLVGTGGSRPLVTSGMTLGAGLDGASIESMHFTGVGSSGTIIRMLGSVLNLTLDDCVIDGATSSAHGFGGGQLEGDCTVTHCRFVDVYGWSLFESRSGSGGGGSPLNVVNFTNNTILNCNGTVVFRGDATSLPASIAKFTNQVNIIGNRWDSIGGNGTIQGSQWAAFEINRCKDAKVYCNTINDVNLGDGGEGEIFQAWSCTSLDVRDNTFTNCDQGIWIARVDGSVRLDPGDTIATFGKNNFSGNGWSIKSNPTLSDIDARANWWGDASGPLDQNGTTEASFGSCFPIAAMLNADGLGDELLTAPAGTDIVDYCPWLIAPSVSTLELSAPACPIDAHGAPGYQIAVELDMLDLKSLASGYATFVDYDMAKFLYRGDLSSYTLTPFPAHFSPIAQLDDGRLELDGSFTFGSGDVGTCDDALLATLVFDVLTLECAPVDPIVFEVAGTFPSELSFAGLPIPTALVNPGAFTLDITDPVLVGVPLDIVQPADAGSCAGAVVTWSGPTATDDCDPSPTVVCTPASGSFFSLGLTTVTCTATDACGNSSSDTFDVTISATNAVDVIVHLSGSMPANRCIHFVTDTCGTVADATLTFVGSSPAIAVATIEVPCGNWTKLCAKDEQHTQWDETGLTIFGSKYLTTSILMLDGGDTDNDADIDINDVTLYLAQFGNPASAGGCPWTGVRDADFNNSGTVGSGDYPFFTAGWLTATSCSCTIPLVAQGDPALRRQPQTTLPVAVVPLHLRSRVDLDRNGLVDYRDVFLFELQRGLPHELSEAMRVTTKY